MHEARNALHENTAAVRLRQNIEPKYPPLRIVLGKGEQECTIAKKSWRANLVSCVEQERYDLCQSIVLICLIPWPLPDMITLNIFQYSCSTRFVWQYASHCHESHSSSLPLSSPFVVIRLIESLLHVKKSIVGGFIASRRSAPDELLVYHHRSCRAEKN